MLNALKNIKLWIFDMDGTLTIPVHDFVEIRKQLGIPLDEDILDFIDAQPDNQKALLNDQLHKIEQDLANEGVAQPGVFNLLEHLKDCGASLAVLTRNNIENTETTLKKAGLYHFFESSNNLLA